MSNSRLVMPHLMESEKIVLGSLILNPDLFNNVSDILQPSDFYANQHKIIYKTIVDLFIEYKHFNILKLIESLKTLNLLDKVGGELYIHGLQQLSAPQYSIQEYAKNLKRVSLNRQTIEDAVDLIAACKDLTSESIQEKVQQLLNKISKRENSSSEVTYLNLKQAIQLTINKMMQGHGKRLTTPFPQLNDIISGFQNSDMILIGARPSIGKTALALTFMIYLMSNKHKVGFISAEMPFDAIIKRIFCQLTGTTYKKLTEIGIDSTEELEALTETISFLSSLNFIIDDKALHISDVKRSIRQMKQNEGIEIVFIDYLQRLSSGGKKDNQEMTYISAEIKSLAKELDIPIVVLSQLNRNPDSRLDKRPFMSDLRDSGSIEQDADVIMLLYREDYYDPQTTNQNDLEIIIPKNRNGEISTIHLFFDKKTMSFKNYAGACSEHTSVE